MCKANTQLPRGKIWTVPIIQFGLKLEQYLFANLDEQARHDGWEIVRLRRGVGRRYRDPRFDLLRRCPACLGSGSVDAQPCRPCEGTGRITRARPCTPTPGGADRA